MPDYFAWAQANLKVEKIPPRRANAGGTEIRCTCPLHDDREGSLWVTSEGLAKCFAGCEFGGTVKGLAQKAGLHPPPNNGRPPQARARGNQPARVVIAEYDYKDESGKLVYRVVRYAPKDFRVKRPDGKGGWIHNLKGVDLILYNLPKVTKADTVLLCEGERDCDALNKLGFTATTSQGGASTSQTRPKWYPSYSQSLAGKTVYLIPDNDEAGHAHMAAAARSLQGVAKAVFWVELPDLPPGGDVYNYLEKHNKADLQALLDAAPDANIILEQERQEQGDAASGLIAVTLEDFLSRELPPRSYLLKPVISEQGIDMLFGPRGAGKTFVALSIGVAVSSGGTALRWQGIDPSPVLYLDGEMPATVMQERLAQILAGADREIPPGFFKIVTPDLVKNGIMPNLATTEGQARLEPLLDGIKLVVVDNIATLARAGKENEVESWLPVQGWLLSQRRAGRSVLLVHHAGKGGDQRGTSAREDILDTVIRLARPKDYQAREGARFTVELTKCRGLTGPETDPFEATLTALPSGGLTWTVTDLADWRLEKVREFVGTTMSFREIAEETGIPKSTVARLLKKLEGKQ